MSIDYARIAYGVYREASGGQSLLNFEDLDEATRIAWDRAAWAVIHTCTHKYPALSHTEPGEGGGG